MAIVTVSVPKCDGCGEIWLPDKRLPNGELNPARENPELCKRCGKCKTPTWNSKSKDRGRRNTNLAIDAASTESLSRNHKTVPNGAGLEQLYGVLADAYKELGGGDAYLKAERNWGPDAWERYEKQHEPAHNESHR